MGIMQRWSLHLHLMWLSSSGHVDGGGDGGGGDGGSDGVMFVLWCE